MLIRSVHRWHVHCDWAKQRSVCSRVGDPEALPKVWSISFGHTNCGKCASPLKCSVHPLTWFGSWEKSMFISEVWICTLYRKAEDTFSLHNCFSCAQDEQLTFFRNVFWHQVFLHLGPSGFCWSSLSGRNVSRVTLTAAPGLRLQLSWGILPGVLHKNLRRRRRCVQGQVQHEDLCRLIGYFSLDAFPFPYKLAEFSISFKECLIHMEQK